jgi:uncharacterized protein YyaL (SSP411 family)
MKEISLRNMAALSAARATHAAPPVDVSRNLDSTALAASALLQAGAVLDRRDAVDAALRALDLVLKANPDPSHGIRHSLDAPVERSPIMMEDQVYFGTALLDAYEITGEGRYLEAASKISSALIHLFLDKEGGGFYDILPDEDEGGYLRLRRKPMIDNVAPSPEGSAALFLLRLGAITGDASLRPLAAGAILWTSTHLPKIDEKAATLGLALDDYLQERLRITVGGTGPAAEELLGAAWKVYAPGRVITRVASSSAAASVCVATRCRDGIVVPGEIRPAVAEVGGAAPGASGSVAAP